MKHLKGLLIICFLVFYSQLQASQPQWWKGNLHMHTLWSDGRAYPEVAVDVYKKMGYNFVSLTDHDCIPQGTRWIDVEGKYSTAAIYKRYVEQFGADWVETREADGKKQVRLKPLNEFRHLFEEPGKFMLIQGDEITHYAHLNAINIIEEIPNHKRCKTAKESIDFATSNVRPQEQKYEQPMLLSLNHPNFKWRVKAEDFLKNRDILFFELHNASQEYFGDNKRVGMELMWDIILTRRLAEFDLPLIYGQGADDAHYYLGSKGLDGTPVATPGRAWIVVRAKYLTPESIIAAMHAGDFYVSTGVVLDDISFDGKSLNVKIKPVSGVKYVTEFVGTLEGYDANSSPVLDANGQEINTTRKYSRDIGQVLKKVQGTEPSYRLTGKEIYVRARIRSSRQMKNPTIPGEPEMAWTQPIKGKFPIK
jgi:hypothetical protein